MKLENEELEILKVVLQNISIKKRTGELGMVHGDNRFISRHISFKKDHLDILDEIAKKAGLSNGVSRFEK